MGHSTGSQCVLHYLHRPNPHTGATKFDPELEHVERPPLDGAIMQAPVSDREALLWVVEEGFGDKTPSEMRVIYERMEAMAKDAARRDEPNDIILPLSITSHIYSQHPDQRAKVPEPRQPESPQSPSEDDLFSSDLSDEQLRKTFGAVHQQGLLKHKLMVLMSGADQSVPAWVDKDKLLSRWQNATDRNGEFQIWDQERSGQIPGASHALSNDDQAEPRKFLVNKVLGFWTHGDAVVRRQTYTTTE